MNITSIVKKVALFMMCGMGPKMASAQYLCDAQKAPETWGVPIRILAETHRAKMSFLNIPQDRFSGKYRPRVPADVDHVAAEILLLNVDKNDGTLRLPVFRYKRSVPGEFPIFAWKSTYHGGYGKMVPFDMVDVNELEGRRYILLIRLPDYDDDWKWISVEPGNAWEDDTGKMEIDFDVLQNVRDTEWKAEFEQIRYIAKKHGFRSDVIERRGYEKSGTGRNQ